MKVSEASRLRHVEPALHEDVAKCALHRSEPDVARRGDAHGRGSGIGSQVRMQDGLGIMRRGDLSEAELADREERVAGHGCVKTTTASGVAALA